jgi:type IV pilus assembly protein PilW
MKQRGVTISELMISMVIGLTIVSVLLAIFSNSSSSTRLSDAQAQMNEDALYALQLLARQIRLANYRDPSSSVTFGLFGCENGFSNVSGAGAAANLAGLTCNASAATGGHGLAVAYDADRYNSTLHALSNNPTDCTGTAVALGGAPFINLENRFFVDGGSRTLRCSGNGEAIPFATSVPMVENIERIDFFYGVANAADQSAVQGYLTTNNLGAANSPEWQAVRSVRICLTMRSERPVLETGNSIYEPCNPVVYGNTPITVNDRYLRKTYSMTVAVRNLPSTP